MNRCFLLLVLLGLAGSCYRVSDQIDPRVNCQLQDRHLQNLTSAFPPLSWEEKQSDWGKECMIAAAFAQELDLYRAVSTYKRAEILIPPEESDRLLEIQYDILFCYFLGKRYEDALAAFERSDLSHVDKTFPAYRDLLLILYESYREMECPDKQAVVLELMEKSYPDTAEQMQLSRAMREADLARVELFANDFHGDSYLNQFLCNYELKKKSVAKAQIFNALCPGAGYFYIGQKKSAATAFLLNGLFIAAAYEFFHHGHTVGGVITLGFEAGWYFGGIYGAGEEAKYYNERLYEKSASATLGERNLFPVLMLEHTF